MTTAGKQLIQAFLKESDPNKRLYITPILDPTQVGGASVDLRLGFDFLSVRRGNLAVFDPAENRATVDRFRTRHLLNRKDPFYLHPNETVLASTLEYVRLPSTLAAYVTSRSKWGRLGLIIATATAIHPGFTGTITLELVNHGTVPLVLYPGLRVAQLILNETKGAEKYDGSLGKQTGPRAVDVGKDSTPDRDFWFPEQ
jgi:dCTP deaminase